MNLNKDESPERLNSNNIIIHTSSIKEIDRLLSLEREKNKKKRGNFILRQEINDYTPRMTSNKILIFYFLFTISFFLCGFIILLQVNSLFYIEIDYSDCTFDLKIPCIKSFVINNTVQSPIYIHYHISEFYNNHKDFVKSKSMNQRQGKNEDLNSFSICKNTKYLYELFDNNTEKYVNFYGKQLESTDYSIPCGMIAKSIFNDTYKLMYTDENLGKYKELEIERFNITPFYIKDLYNNNPDLENKQWIDMKNESFIIWDLMDSSYDIKKQYGLVRGNLNPGYYNISIVNNYNLNVSTSIKKISISQSSRFGNTLFLGYMFISGGAISLVVSIGILIIQFTNSKKFNIEFLEWRKKKEHVE